MPNIKDLTGKRFGRLVAIRATDERRNSHVVWECQCDCGAVIKTTQDHLRAGGTKSCGCLKRDKIRGENNPRWNGGRQVKRGYISLKKPEHPGSDVEGYVREHRLVMEKKLSRHLKPEEVVHHIDGNPANNAIDNLMLFPNDGAHTAHHRAIERAADGPR